MAMWQCGNDKWEAQVYDFRKVHGEGRWVNNHYYQNGVQFTSLNHYGTFKVK
jgi:hypothetical protein